MQILIIFVNYAHISRSNNVITNDGINFAVFVDEDYL